MKFGTANLKHKNLDWAGQKIRMSRRVYFSSAHLYEIKSWTPEQNIKEFGKCYSAHGHGHNYILEAFFEGPIDGATGMLVNLMDVETCLKKVTDEFDHQHINFDHPDFKALVPTTENLAMYLWRAVSREISASHLKVLKLYKIRLFEEPDLYSEVIGDS